MGNGVQIVVDGMTGVGKTTLLEILAGELDLEPYTEIFEDDSNLLHKFFLDRRRWCFPMQINFLNHRFRQYKEASARGASIMDRSIYSDDIFASMYRETCYLTGEEYGVYRGLLENMLEHLKPPRLAVYLRVDPEEAIRRIHLRGRQDEVIVESEYWQRLHRCYENHYRRYSLGELMFVEVNDIDFVKYKSHRKQIVDQIRIRWEQTLRSSVSVV